MRIPVAPFETAGQSQYPRRVSLTLGFVARSCLPGRRLTEQAGRVCGWLFSPSSSAARRMAQAAGRQSGTTTVTTEVRKHQVSGEKNQAAADHDRDGRLATGHCDERWRQLEQPRAPSSASKRRKAPTENSRQESCRSLQD